MHRKVDGCDPPTQPQVDRCFFPGPRPAFALRRRKPQIMQTDGRALKEKRASQERGCQPSRLFKVSPFKFFSRLFA